MKLSPEPPKMDEFPTGINVTVTHDENNRPMTIIEKGDIEGVRLGAQFGIGGKEFCFVVSDKLSVASGDAVVSRGQNHEHIVNISQGAPSQKTPTLEKDKVKPITSILIKKGDDASFHNLLGRVETKQDVIKELKEIDVYMSRVEETALTRTSNYTFIIDNEKAEVWLTIGDGKYIKSDGFTSLTVSEGTVYIKTPSGDSISEVVINIG